jgi:HEAT repeat protein
MVNGKWDREVTPFTIHYLPFTLPPMKNKGAKFLFLFLLALGVVVIARAQDDDGFDAKRKARVDQEIRRLTDLDPLVRQRAAEVLAGLAAVEHQRLIEGYALQEKNGRVKLALNWALYRTGQNTALYSIVRDFQSDGRRPQAVRYLSQLAGPEPLRPFFHNADKKTLIGLLDVMAKIGDEQMLEQIKPLTTNPDPEISKSARFAHDEIALRLSESPNPISRPRAVENPTDAEP